MFRLQKLDKIGRKYELDLWNEVHFRKKLSKLSLLFIRNRLSRMNFYKSRATAFDIGITHNVKRRRRLSAYGKTLETRKKLCYYYGGLSKRKYRSYNWKAKKMPGSFSLNMLYLLESQLCIMAYRFHFCKTVLEGIHLVLSGNVFVNKKVVLNPQYHVLPGDIIEISGPLRELKFTELNSSVKNRPFFLLKHLEVNFGIFCGSLIRVPFSEFAGKN